ncbi:MAG: hypothetical protein ACOH15_07560 [Acetobacterium sp.]
MRIKKVFIKNFKGIKEKKIIDFPSSISLLTGPNGFGKTTIFDILELCLTGEMNRTLEKAHVTKDSSDYIKPFYQNTIGEEVLIKVWLEKKCEQGIEELIIVKFLAKDNNGKINFKGRKNKPCDFNLLQTYQELPEDFEKENFISNEENRIHDNIINDFFDLKSTGSNLKSVYRLFNYLQQEDTTYFLKKSEKDRKDSLGFLFQTVEQEKKLEELNNLIFKLNGINNHLDSKIIMIEKSELVQEKKYSQLFCDGDYEFDTENVFGKYELDMCIKIKENIFIELNKILKFLKEFSPQEYSKKRKLELLNEKIRNNRLIEFYVLQNLLEKNCYEKLTKEREFLNNDNMLQAFLLQYCSLKYEKYNNININFDNYEKFLKIKDYEKQIIKMEPFVKKLMPELIEDYSNLLFERTMLVLTTNEIDKSINEVIRLRNTINIELNNNMQYMSDDTSCPYCGKYWETYDELLLNFRDREKTLKKLASNQLSRLKSYDNNIDKKLLEPIKTYMVNFIKENKQIDSKILKLFKENSLNQFEFDELKKIDRINELVWTEPGTFDELRLVTENVKQIIKENLHVSQEIFEKVIELHNVSLEKDIEELEKLCKYDGLNKFIIPYLECNQLTNMELENIKQSLKKYLEKEKENYKYDHAKSCDVENIYEKYFKSNNENFLKISEENISEKKEYIDYKFAQNQNIIRNQYISRKAKLNTIIGEIDKTKIVYSKIIKDHKINMINKIKIPFHIYSAKILQNYQQGMGVFLSSKTNNDSIRFLTDSSSDHDAMHLLSSGQLAVISLAFCLSINKTYNISESLKILTIDDPIQEMDALNIHSFVELIRHEFIEDYQLIFSTHNDLNALYMKYKFEKMKENCAEIINVQSEFYS